MWCAYASLAIFATWPLCLSPASAISMGFEGEATVPLLNVWTVWWNSDRLSAGLHGYWDAPIFFPTRGTFAFSEVQPTSMLVAPVIWLTGSRVLAYNSYLLSILTLNGWSSHRLLRRLGHVSPVAACGGVMCQMLPFVWWQSGVVQLTTLFGIVFTVHALLDVFELQQLGSPGPQVPAGTGWRLAALRGLRLGGAFGVTYLLCNYWGLYLAVVAAPALVWLWRWKSTCVLGLLELCAALVVAALVSAVLVGPLAMMQRSLARQHEWTRDPGLIRDLSAHPRDYLDTPRTNPAQVRPQLTAPADAAEAPVVDPIAWSLVPQWDAPEADRRDLWTLGPGVVKLVLAPVGLLAALMTRGRRQWGLFAGTFAAVAFGLSLGPTVGFAPWVPVCGDQCPYVLVQKYVPGFALVRSPFRFALFFQLAVIWLNVEALDLLNPRRWRRQAPDDAAAKERTFSLPALGAIDSRQLLSLSLSAPMVLAGLFLIFEVWPPRSSLYRCPSMATAPAWIQWLRENSDPADALVCLPFPTGYHVRDYEETALWMYWGTLHHRPMVNGYSGFFPRHFVDLKDELARFNIVPGEAAIPRLNLYPGDSPGLNHLNKCKARFAVVKRSFATRDDVWRHPITKFRWAWVASDEQHQLDVYEIVRDE